MPGSESLPLLLVTALLGLRLLSSPGNSQDTEVPAPQAAKPEIATPQPEKILLEACDLLTSVKQFSYKAEITDDRVYTGGKKLQLAFDLQAYMQRPDKLRINAGGRGRILIRASPTLLARVHPGVRESLSACLPGFPKKIKPQWPAQFEAWSKSLCGFHFFSCRLFLTDKFNPGLTAQAEQRLLGMQWLQPVLIQLRH